MKCSNILIIIVALTNHVDASNILYISPLPAISHYQMLEPLMVSLAERGHNITVISHYPQKIKLQNYREIDLRGTTEPYELDFVSWGLINDLIDTFRYGGDYCELFVSLPVIQDFIKNENEKFDLIFVEAFDSDCYLGFVERFKAPYILYSAMALPIWLSDWIYNPGEVAYVPDHMCRLSGRLEFLQRVENVLCQTVLRGFYWFNNQRRSVGIVNKYFGTDLEDLDDMKKNVSMIFLNSFHGVNGIRPYLPNVVELGGIHVKPGKPLPNNIEKFLNESKDGVILFSMGSMVKSHTLDPTIRDGLVSVFSKLKERVLWKWEKDFPGLPENVMTSPWVPQADVLAHPNIKLFISHGGIHGVIESMHHGVPIVGMPLYGDQKTNLKNLEWLGAAVTLDFNNFNVFDFANAINKVLQDDSYRNNAQRLSGIMRDRPHTPLQTAIYWTEYVLRHKGAPHFKSGALNLTWMQYLLIDVWLACISFLIALILIFYFPLKYLRKRKTKDKTKSKKNN